MRRKLRDHHHTVLCAYQRSEGRREGRLLQFLAVTFRPDRKPADNVPRQALDWNPQGNRKVGRPKQSWRRSVENEAKDAGMSWTQLKRAAQNIVRWRSVVAALCSTGSLRNMSSKSSVDPHDPLYYHLSKSQDSTNDEFIV